MDTADATTTECNGHLGGNRLVAVAVASLEKKKETSVTEKNHF